VRILLFFGTTKNCRSRNREMNRNRYWNNHWKCGFVVEWVWGPCGRRRR